MSDEINSQADEATAPSQPYTKPDIAHELALETRAGSPLRIDPGIDPLGIDPTQQK
jgi:hypothetical protein